MSSKNQIINTAQPNSILLKDAEYGLVRTSYIEFSPLNYRKYFSEESLNEFALELKQHGMISPVTEPKAGNCLWFFYDPKAAPQQYGDLINGGAA